MKFITTTEAAKRWGLSSRRVGVLCGQGRIPDVQKAGNTWLIPEYAKKPADARTRGGKFAKPGLDRIQRGAHMIDISTILSQKEKINLEAKLAQGGLPNSVWDTYSSFANTFGGVILLGVDEDRKTKKLIPRGVPSPDRLISDIWNTLNNRQKVSANILLDRHVYPVERDGVAIVVVEVPRADRRDRPVYIGQDMLKGTFRRNHEGDYHCSREEVKAMLRDQADTSQDALALENLTLDALNRESVRRYRILFDNKKPKHVWSSLGNEEFLMKIGAATRSREDGGIHPTLGGLVFFGDFNTITDELPNFFLDYRERLSGETRWSDRVCSCDGDWSGNVFDFYYKIIDRLTSDVKRPFKLDGNLMRIDDTPVHASLRECLANALIHADYHGRRGIVVEKRFRDITFSNPGTFRIGIDEAIAGGISDARNARIFNMFSLINVGERSGSGLCDVFHVWEENGFERPEILETVDPDRVTLTLRMAPGGIAPNYDRNPEGNVRNPGGNVRNPEGNVRNSGGNDRNPEGNDRNSGGNVRNLRENAPDWDAGLSANERKVLETLRSSPASTAKQTAAVCGISEKTVVRLCGSLKEKGYIKRIGSTRGKWVVLK